MIESFCRWIILKEKLISLLFHINLKKLVGFFLSEIPCYLSKMQQIYFIIHYTDKLLLYTNLLRIQIYYLLRPKFQFPFQRSNLSSLLLPFLLITDYTTLPTVYGITIANMGHPILSISTIPLWVVLKAKIALHNNSITFPRNILFQNNCKATERNGRQNRIYIFHFPRSRACLQWP